LSNRAWDIANFEKCGHPLCWLREKDSDNSVWYLFNEPDALARELTRLAVE